MFPQTSRQLQYSLCTWHTTGIHFGSFFSCTRVHVYSYVPGCDLRVGIAMKLVFWWLVDAATRCQTEASRPAGALLRHVVVPLAQGNPAWSVVCRSLDTPSQSDWRWRWLQYCTVASSTRVQSQVSSTTVQVLSNKCNFCSFAIGKARHESGKCSNAQNAQMLAVGFVSVASPNRPVQNQWILITQHIWSCILFDSHVKSVQQTLPTAWWRLGNCWGTKRHTKL